jgi:DNA-binding response OmpR family regulator
MYKIFIVEDDPVLGSALERQLSHRGYQVWLVRDFQNILTQFEAYQPHLVLLDVSLPFFDGFYWCGEIRRISQAPILFLTCAGDDVNLVMAVNEGADDLIPKPFRMEAVLAKIQAVLRRAYSFGGQQELVRYEDISLNPGRGIVSCGQAKVQLTKNESQILQILLESRGEIVPRESMMRSLWEDESFIDENTLTVNVARLRKKLKETGIRPFIGTQKGIGYFVRAGA